MQSHGFKNLYRPILLFSLIMVNGAVADDNLLPGGIGLIYVSPQGDVFGISDRGVYVSEGALKTWRLFALAGPDEDTVGVAGGSIERPVVLTRFADGGRVRMLSPTTAPTTLFESKQEINRGAFFSATVGCIAAGGSVVLTFDGGKTWTPPFHVFKGFEAVNCIRWISEHEILLGGTVSGLRDYPVTHRIGPAAKWSTTMPSTIAQIEAAGQGNVAVLSDKLHLLSLASGRQIAECQPRLETEGFGFADSKVVFYGYNGISTWSWDGKTYQNDKTIEGAYDNVIFARGEPIVLTEDHVFKLKNDRLVSWPITIEKTPLVERLEKPPKSAATTAELESVFEWARKVDPVTRERIFGEANNMKQLSPRDRLLWARDQFKRMAQGGPATTDSATTKSAK